MCFVLHWFPGGIFCGNHLRNQQKKTEKKYRLPLSIVEMLAVWFKFVLVKQLSRQFHIKGVGESPISSKVLQVDPWGNQCWCPTILQLSLLWIFLGLKFGCSKCLQFVWIAARLYLFSWRAIFVRSIYLMVTPSSQQGIEEEGKRRRGTTRSGL